MLIHRVAQLSEGRDVLVKIFHRVHPLKDNLNVVGDVFANLSLLIVVSAIYQVLHLMLIHTLQSHRLLTVFSLQTVGEGVHLREPIVIPVDSPLVKCLS